MKLGVLMLVAAAVNVGCGVYGYGGGAAAEAARQQQIILGQMPDANTMMAKQQLMQDMLANPDLAAWHDQREKMSLALGDRQFDKGFDAVFDAMTVALANLGCRVQNMERVSGYIASSIPELPPAQLEALNRDANRQYAVAKGYPPSIVEKSNSPYDFAAMDIGATMNRQMSGLTLSMVKQGPATTKVKLRFDKVYYPPLIEEYYKIVWAAVDKQMFLDKGLD